MLDWAALILIDIEDNNMQISRNILDEFLQLSYIQKLLQNYEESSDDSSKENSIIFKNISDLDAEKPKNNNRIEKSIGEKEKENEHAKMIYKYLKKLNAKSSEFYPNSKKFNTHSEPFISKKKDEKLMSEKTVDVKKQEKADKIKKLAKNEVKEFIPANRKNKQI